MLDYLVYIRGEATCGSILLIERYCSVPFAIHDAYLRINRITIMLCGYDDFAMRKSVSYFLFRQKVGKNHATRSLWQNPFNCPFPGRRSQSASLRRYLASPCVLALRRAPFLRPVNGLGGFCYVRYRRGAGRGLASPTLGLLEGK